MIRLIAALVFTFLAVIAGLIAVNYRSTADAPFQTAGCINGACS